MIAMAMCEGRRGTKNRCRERQYGRRTKTTDLKHYVVSWGGLKTLAMKPMWFLELGLVGGGEREED